MTTEQALNHVFYRDIKDLVEAGFSLSLKLKEYGWKNIEINDEKIKFVKKKFANKEAKNKSIINANLFYSKIKDKKRHIVSWIDRYMI